MLKKITLLVAVLFSLNTLTEKIKIEKITDENENKEEAIYYSQTKGTVEGYTDDNPKIRELIIYNIQLYKYNPNDESNPKKINGALFTSSKKLNKKEVLIAISQITTWFS